MVEQLVPKSGGNCKLSRCIFDQDLFRNVFRDWLQSIDRWSNVGETTLICVFRPAGGLKRLKSQVPFILGAENWSCLHCFSFRRTFMNQLSFLRNKQHKCCCTHFSSLNLFQTIILLDYILPKTASDHVSMKPHTDMDSIRK